MHIQHNPFLSFVVLLRCQATCGGLASTGSGPPYGYPETTRISQAQQKASCLTGNSGHRDTNATQTAPLKGGLGKRERSAVQTLLQAFKTCDAGNEKAELFLELNLNFDDANGGLFLRRHSDADRIASSRRGGMDDVELIGSRVVFVCGVREAARRGL